MNFNLKNRPHKLIHGEFDADVTEEWFEGFEAELREMLKETKAFIDNLNVQKQPIMFNYYKGNFDVIKEILGE